MEQSQIDSLNSAISSLTTQISDITKKVTEITNIVTQSTAPEPAKPSDVFPATTMEVKFPSGKKGTIAYLNGSGVYRKYSLSNEEVIVSPMGKFEDSMTKIIEQTDVTLVDKGLVYKAVHTPGEVFFTPVLNQSYPVRQYKVYFGNPYNPQGQIVFFDGNNQSKAITKFGVSDTITITKFTQISNCTLVAL